MKIRFEIGARSFEIESISRWQVELNEIVINQNEKSPNYQKEQYVFLGYHKTKLRQLKDLSI